MKYINRILLLVLTLSVGFACTDLDESLRGDLTEGQDVNNFGFGNTPNVNGSIPDDGLGSAYAALLNGTANHANYFAITEVSSDEITITQKGGDWFDGGIWLNMHRHDFRSTNPGLNDAWTAAYGGITESNSLLAGGNLNANQTAQIRTLRAYYYWRLMDTFGRVKIITTPGGDAAQVDRPDVYAFVTSEILAAIPDLGPNNGYSRLNEFSAYAMLAKIYLNAEVYTRPYPYTPGTGTAAWQAAIDAADYVINNGGYGLDPDFAKVFAPDNVDNTEHIFIVPYDQTTGGGMNFAQMTLHYPSQLTFDLAEQPWNGYSSLEAFYNSFDNADVRKEASFIEGAQFDAGGTNPILDVAFDQDDPDGAPINYTPFINEIAPNGSRQGGVRLGKFSFKQGQGNDMDNDYTILRYADVIVAKAEAIARLNGDWSHPTTLTLVNQLRTRAGVSAYSALTADEFLAELGREFFQESKRRMDLIRFEAWGNPWWEKSAHSDDFKNVMPIPLDQINATTDGSLTQHADY